MFEKCLKEELKLLRDTAKTNEGRRKLAFLIAPQFVSDPDSGLHFLRNLTKDKKAYRDLLARILAEATMRFSSDPKYPAIVEMIEEQVEGWEGF